MIFNFRGDIPASKSILNRLLVMQSFSPKLSVTGDSDCDDVMRMRSALPKLLSAKRQELNCGAAGTTFRFLVMRASRIPGRHVLTGTPKLLARPQTTLIDLLSQLGVSAQLADGRFIVEGEGWQKPRGPVRVERSQSSQFASALILSAWDLPFALELENGGGAQISQGYLDMTLALVQQAGMELRSAADLLVIPEKSAIKEIRIAAEPDLSSAFAIAALGALSGDVTITNFPSRSLQPDAVFPSIIRKMGAFVQEIDSQLRVSSKDELKGVEVDLGNCPDLFPVLAVLCAFARGSSKLFGAPQLAHKESSRIESTAKLLSLLGARFESRQDGMEISGGTPIGSEKFDFDPQDDHRLAMAAAVAKSIGVDIRVLHPEVVDKSFPEFWEIYAKGSALE